MGENDRAREQFLEALAHLESMRAYLIRELRMLIALREALDGPVYQLEPMLASVGAIDDAMSELDA